MTSQASQAAAKAGREEIGGIQANLVTSDKTSESLESAATNACLLCGNSEKVRFLFRLARPILKCEVCGLVYAEPIRGGTDPKEYGEAYYCQGAYADYSKDRPAIQKNATRVLRELEGLVSGRSLLDVGCANGFFLDAARARGWSVRGLEYSDYASTYAREQLKLPVDTGSILTPPADLPKFDVITLWDTIEHLDRPDLAVANIRDHLRSKGLFVFSTGDYGSLLRRFTGKGWRLFSDPTHNFFFDESALRRLLADAGFNVIRVSRRGKWVSLSMILHQSKLPLAPRLRAWLSDRDWNPAIYVNPRDVVTIFAVPVS